MGRAWFESKRICEVMRPDPTKVMPAKIMREINVGSSSFSGLTSLAVSRVKRMWQINRYVLARLAASISATKPVASLMP